MTNLMFTTQMAGDSGLLALFIITTVWSLAWKGWALWIAGGKRSKPWFIALLVINTFGLLEILYIFIFSKRGENNKEGMIDVEKVVKEENTTV